MLKVLKLIFLIFGTVVGSGFSSGKEIMIYFSRFGSVSYFFIVLAGLLFFCLFYYFLRAGNKILKLAEGSKIIQMIIFAISLVFCSSMFAGVESLFSFLPLWANVCLFLFIIFLCFCVIIKGVDGLEKANIILMPITSLIFLCILVYGLSLKSGFDFSVSGVAGMLYCPLYVTLNTSMSSLVIARAGDGLNKKQAFYASLFSTLLLLLFLIMGNIVLQQNAESILSEMPFLYLAKKSTVMFCATYFVILVGCFTTLISLCSTLKSSIGKVVKTDRSSAFLAIILPLSLSMFGFSEIVSMLYPVCSVLGILILLFFIFSFKQTNQIIHQKCKNAKYRCGRHN